MLKLFYRSSTLTTFFISFTAQMAFSFPSEWEGNLERDSQPRFTVSIQLVFPASGKERSLKPPLLKHSTKDFRKPLFKLHFSHRYCQNLAIISRLQTFKLLNCLGSGVFREPPQNSAPASVHENYWGWKNIWMFECLDIYLDIRKRRSPLSASISKSATSEILSQYNF